MTRFIQKIYSDWGVRQPAVWKKDGLPLGVLGRGDKQPPDGLVTTCSVNKSEYKSVSWAWGGAWLGSFRKYILLGESASQQFG